MTFEVEHHATIDAEPDVVWAIVRDFAGVSRWNPIAESSRLVVGADGQPGAERELTLTDGGIVRERLVRRDDTNRLLVYRMVTFPIPVTAQENAIRVEPANDDMRADVAFTATFSPAAGHGESQLRAINLRAFTAAAEGLAGAVQARVAAPRGNPSS